MSKNHSTPLTETPAYKFTNAIYRWFVISLLWFVCSLPLITIGAASAAAMGEFSDPENHYWHKLIRDYFCRFRRCFLRTTGLWLLFLMLTGLLILDVSFYRQLSDGTGFLPAAVAVIIGNLLLGFVRFGCFTAVTEENCGFRRFLRHTGKMMLLCLPVWTAMVAIDLATVSTLAGIPYLLFLLVLLPGLYAHLHCKLIQMFLRRFESESV